MRESDNVWRLSGGFLTWAEGFGLAQSPTPAADPMARTFIFLPLRQRGAFFDGVWTGEHGCAGAAHAHIGVWRDGL